MPAPQSSFCMEKIPVTIISGFLGSGKTTLLNSIVKKHPSTRFAIVENEFGDINIDAELVVGAESGNIFELSNGCICCSMNDDFYKTLEDLLKIRDRFDRLIVETTGIADPLTVIRSFISTAEVADCFDVDAVICVLDAPIFEELLEEQEEVSRQLVMADIVIVNKVDSITPGYLDSLKMVVGRINPSATIFATSFGNIDTLDIVGVEAFTGRQIEQAALKYANVMPLKGLANAPGFTGMIATKALKHNIQSHSYEFKGEFDYDKFLLWMESFFYFSSSRVFRVKGILAFSGRPKRMVFHSVRGAFMLEEGREWERGEERGSRIVFIGKNLMYDEIQQALSMLAIKEG